MNSKGALKVIVLVILLAGIGYLLYKYAWPYIQGMLGKLQVTGTPETPNGDTGVFYGRFGTWTIWWKGEGHYWAEQDGATADQTMNGIGVTPEAATIGTVINYIISHQYDIPK